ncbi:MAG: ZIP family metal transporter [Candidatus Pacebacteria bacterium]|nr:ZIP family metal transporter [Candidatus Paceibacterota bacterium]
MIAPYIYALLGVVAVSLVSLVGLFTLSRREEVIKKYIYFFVSLAVGALLGDTFIHLIPESFENLENSTMVGLLVIAGFFLFFVIEKFLHWHHHDDDGDENHVHPVGELVLFSDGVHNFIDGVVIGVSFMISVPVGIATTIAVVLHEIPQEIGDFAVLLHAGYSRKRALWLNFLSALAAVFGTLVAFLLGETGEGLISYILPIAAGGFIYIAAADLIPELQKNKVVKQSVFQFLSIALGVILMLALTLLE